MCLDYVYRELDPWFAGGNRGPDHGSELLVATVQLINYRSLTTVVTSIDFMTGPRNRSCWFDQTNSSLSPPPLFLLWKPWA